MHVRRGVLASASTPAGDRGLWWASLLSAGSAAVLSHLTAALVWRLPVPIADREIHVTLGRTHARTASPGTVHHYLRLESGDRRSVDGFPITSLVRTVLDCCLVLDDAPAFALLEHVLGERRVTLPQLYEQLVARAAWHGTRRLIVLVRSMDPGAQSRAERRLQAGLRRRGLTGWVAQYVVTDDLGHVRRLDVAFPALRLGIEVDGWAWHSDRERFQRDRRAHNRLDVLGWRVLHFTWEDVMFRLDEVIDEVERRRQALTVDVA